MTDLSIVLYKIFDFGYDGTHTLRSLILIYEIMLIGFCRATDNNIPNYRRLRAYTLATIVKSDAKDAL